MECQVFEDEVLAGAESTDHPAEETSERREHSRNHIGKVRIELCAKSFILQVHEVLARHRLLVRVSRGTPVLFQYPVKKQKAQTPVSGLYIAKLVGGADFELTTFGL